MNFLDRIRIQKQKEIEKQKQDLPLNALKSFVQKQNRPKFSLLQKLKADKDFHLICEIKKASPSAGIISPHFKPKAQAQFYQTGGASAVSVLTDTPHFKGSLNDLMSIRPFVSLPVLRKDFIIDAYQIWQSVYAGADLILLIARLLPQNQIRRLAHLAAELGLEILLELHTLSDLQKIPPSSEALPLVLGINNRNLETMQIDIRKASELIRHLPSNYPVISESGIRTTNECIWLKKQGFRGVLMGEVLMRQENPVDFLRNLKEAVRGFYTA